MNIELNGITKRFGGTQALDGVDLRVTPGTVHALVGENGAGKSTLGKVIAGVIAPDEGTYHLAGRVERFSSPRQALEAGVTMMAQELSLVPARSVIENVFLGIESKRGIFVRGKDLDRRYATLVEQTGIVVPGKVPVGSLTVGEQQKVEILRALARDAAIIVMDEPTARLTGDETQALMALIRQLAESGKTVIFVSHFLAEILEIADFVTVMRDGKVVRTSRASDESEESLIEGMTGRSFVASFPKREAAPGSSAPIVLSVASLGQAGAFKDVSFNVRAGEIVAITGLVGSGRSEVLHAIYGDTRPSSGSVELTARAFMPSNPGQALQHGLALVPESRKDQGLFLNMSVEANITMSRQGLIRRRGLVRPKLARLTAQKAADAVGVKSESISTPIAALSGGNQQKALFARALLDSPTLLLADEPTRGVDVAAKRAIYDLLVALASGGMAILMVSSETEEVLGLAHRILVMHEGRIVKELDGTDATEEDIMTAAFSSPGPTS